jgi:hypothetical protein
VDAPPRLGAGIDAQLMQEIPVDLLVLHDHDEVLHWIIDRLDVLQSGRDQSS